MKLGSLRTELTHEFKFAGFDNAPFEARQLIQAALDFSAGDLISRETEDIGEDAVARIRLWTRRRLNGEPLAYLAGKKGFYKAEFFVEPGVLVPRPETELVVETAIRRSKGEIKNFVDLGCGSGCIGLSLLQEWPESKLWAVDASAVAHAITLKNAKAMNLDGRTQVIRSRVEHWSPAVDLDLVVANPPYIADGDLRVGKNVHDFEPHEALYSGPDGFEALSLWSRWAFAHLSPGGLFACEFGAGQSSALEEILIDVGFVEIEIAKDLNGIDRVISARTPKAR